MNPRYLFVYSSLLALFANGAFADEGTYQRTKDGTTLVWNSYPLTGETVEWSGDRDKEGYASGSGTVTWYKLSNSGYTFVKKNHSVLNVRYTGKMVKGKLEGPVEKAASGPKISFRPRETTMHATFVAGNRSSDWMSGPAPISSQIASSSRTSGPSRTGGTSGAEAKAPAEGPASVALKSTKEKTSAPAKETVSAASDSERSVAAPPSLLQKEEPASASSQEAVAATTSSSSGVEPTLTAPDAIQFADAEARANGYDLRKYQNPQANYIAAADTWSVSYDEKHIDGRTDNSKRFNVAVEDKTRKTTLTKGR